MSAVRLKNSGIPPIGLTIGKSARKVAIAAVGRSCSTWRNASGFIAIGAILLTDAAPTSWQRDSMPRPARRSAAPCVSDRYRQLPHSLPESRLLRNRCTGREHKSHGDTMDDWAVPRESAAPVQCRGELRSVVPHLLAFFAASGASWRPPVPGGAHPRRRRRNRAPCLRNVLCLCSSLRQDRLVFPCRRLRSSTAQRP